MWVQRVNGKITGAFRNRQAGYAEEEVADSDPELVAYLNPPRRRARQLAAIMADIGALSAADRNRLFAAVAALTLMEHPGLAAAINVNVAGDEPDE